MSATPSPPNRGRVDRAAWLALATAIAGLAKALVDLLG
jgi:hypothetical protein